MIHEALIASTLMLNSALAAPAPGTSPVAGWKTVAVSGRVETRAGDRSLSTAPAATVDSPAWRPVRRGDVVASSSHLRTQQKARATLTRDGNLILVDAATEIVLPETLQGEGTVVMQSSGNAIYKVAPRKQGTGRFEVRTPFLVAGVKGTRFSVQIRESGAAVSVIEGVVEVKSLLTGDTHDVTGGESIMVEGADGRMDLHRDEDRSPRLLERPSLEPTREFDDVLETSLKLDRELSTDLSLTADLDSTSLWADFDDALPLRDLLTREDSLTAGTATTTDTTTTTLEKEVRDLLYVLPLLPRK